MGDRILLALSKPPGPRGERRWQSPAVVRGTASRSQPPATSGVSDARCVISDRHRFICLLIAKNASSTLRAEFRKDLYQARELRYAEVDPAARRDYFTFTYLRSPVARFLAAYQEISMRFETEPSPKPKRSFFQMEDSPERFRAFLDAAEVSLWDEHIRLQSSFVAGARIDFFAMLERFQSDLETIYARIGLGPSPVLPQRRSREDRKLRYHYDKYLIPESDLDATTLARITRLLDADIRLVAHRTKHPT